MSDHQNWVLTGNPPEGYSGKMYYFDMGSRYGYKHDDGCTWYRLNCSYWFGDWIEQAGRKDQWTAYGAPHRAIYIVREDLMMFIKLKWL